MPFTIPDKGEGQNDLQSILFQEYLDVLVAGISGVDCVLSGGAVTAQGSPDMTVAVAKAAILSNGILKAVTAGNVAITTAHATLPRLDLIVADSSGAKAARAGTAAASPKPPAKTANDVVLAAVYVPAADTTISSAQIVDMRVERKQGPIVIYKVTSPVTFNNTAAIQTYMSLVMPSGLLLAGKSLRVRCGGNILANSGTPAWTLTIAYGGTTLFADTTNAWTADADRAAWKADFDLVAQANNDQALVGDGATGIVGAKTAPASGLGDMNGIMALYTGSAAVDSDAADRTLTVQWTMSVANAANETVMEFATVELM